jgi:hypothetical protein
MAAKNGLFVAGAIRCPEFGMVIRWMVLTTALGIPGMLGIMVCRTPEPPQASRERTTMLAVTDVTKSRLLMSENHV